MSLLGTRWEARYEDCNITVSRNEVTRGFLVECDGRRVAKRSWSLIGLGSVEGTLKFDDREVPIVVTISAGSKCSIKIGGEDVVVELVG